MCDTIPEFVVAAQDHDPHIRKLLFDQAAQLQPVHERHLDTRAAEQLFMHRTSLLRQLERMEYIMGNSIYI